MTSCSGEVRDAIFSKGKSLEVTVVIGLSLPMKFTAEVMFIMKSPVWAARDIYTWSVRFNQVAYP